MDTGKTLDKLKLEVETLGLNVEPSGKNGKFLKKDYVLSLMTYNLIKRYGSLNDVPLNLKFRLSFVSPQLAYGYFDLKAKEQEAIWNDPKIWLTEKISGIRGTIIYSKKGGWSLFGREISDNDYIWSDYTGRVLPQIIGSLEYAVAVDVEVQLGDPKVYDVIKGLGYEVISDFQVVSTLLMLDEEKFKSVRSQFPHLFKFKLLDVYHWVSDLRKLSYMEREGRFDTAVFELSKVGLSIERPQYCKDPLTKKAFHEGIMKSGGEGTVAVFVDKPCDLSGSRKRDGMVKIKRSIFPLLLEPNALTDTVDGWVSAILKVDERSGLVHTIEVSMLNDRGVDVKVAVTEAIPLSVRQSGLLKIGTVVELSGTKWVDGLVEGAVVERIRFDKDRLQCIL